jgi:hypothetical protein
MSNSVSYGRSANRSCDTNTGINHRENTTRTEMMIIIVRNSLSIYQSAGQRIHAVPKHELASFPLVKR